MNMVSIVTKWSVFVLVMKLTDRGRPVFNSPLEGVFIFAFSTHPYLMMKGMLLQDELLA